MGFNDMIHRANLAVARSFVGRRFRLEGSGHPKERKGSYFFTEIRAGLATFFAMAYVSARLDSMKLLSFWIYQTSRF